MTARCRVPRWTPLFQPHRNYQDTTVQPYKLMPEDCDQQGRFLTRAAEAEADLIAEALRPTSVWHDPATPPHDWALLGVVLAFVVGVIVGAFGS